jgi:phage shock protein A
MPAVRDRSGIASDPARRDGLVPIDLVDGDYEARARSHVTTLTIKMTAGELAQYVGKAVSVLTKSKIRVRGWLVDVQPETITIDEHRGDDVEIRIDHLAHFILTRNHESKAAKHERQIATLRAQVADLIARVAELERR